jgi:hypothetical protein
MVSKGYINRGAKGVPKGPQKVKGVSKPVPHALRVISDSLMESLVALYDMYFSHKVLDGVVHFYVMADDVVGVKFMDKVRRLSDEATVLPNGFGSIFSYIELRDGILYEMDLRWVDSLHRYKLGLVRAGTLVADLNQFYMSQGNDLIDYLKRMRPSKKLPIPIIINAERLPNSKVELYADKEVRETVTVEAFQLNLSLVLESIKQAGLSLDLHIMGYTRGQGLLILVKVPE